MTLNPDELREAIKWMLALQGPQDGRIPDQGKVQSVIDAATLLLELMPMLGEIVDLKRDYPDGTSHFTVPANLTTKIAEVLK